MGNTVITWVKKHFYFILIGLLFSLIFVSSVKYLTGNLAGFYNNSDMDIYIALQMKLDNPKLFENDDYFSLIFSRYPMFLNSMLAYLTRIIGSRILLYGILNYLLFVFFWISNYLLAYYIFQNKIVSLIFAIISSYGTQVLFGTYWGIVLGIVSLRDFITSISPLLILLFIKTRKQFKISLFLFFTLGVLVNLHLIYAVSLFSIYILTYLFYNSITLKTIYETSLFSFAFVIGALTFIIHALAFPSTSISLELIQFRLDYQYIFPLLKIISIFCFSTILFFLGLKFKKRHTSEDNMVKLLVLSSLIVSLFFVLLSLEFSYFALFQFMRSNKYIIPFLYLYQSYAIYSLLISKKTLFLFVGIIMFIISLIPINYYFVTLFPEQMKFGTIDLRSESAKNLDTVKEKLSTIYSSESMQEISKWFNTNTNESSRVLCNPFFPGSRFRTLSQKSIIISSKDGAGLMLLRSNLSYSWFNDVKRISALYLIGNTSSFIFATHSYGADYIIAERKLNKLELPELFSNQDFIVYKVPEE